MILLMMNGIEILAMVGLFREMATLSGCPQPSASLSCAAIPRRFIQDEPRCANKLLESMNVTNVRITSRIPDLDEKSAAHVGALCDRVGARVAPSYCSRSNAITAQLERSPAD